MYRPVASRGVYAVPRTAAKSVAPEHGIFKRFVALYQDAWRRLHITNDDFIRTTEPRHRRGVDALLRRCHDAGDIELGVYAGKYCVPCEEYYTDDELDPGDLCRIHRRPVEYYEEPNYFFRLSRFQDRLLAWYDAHPDVVVPAFGAPLFPRRS